MTGNSSRHSGQILCSRTQNILQWPVTADYTLKTVGKASFRRNLKLKLAVKLGFCVAFLNSFATQLTHGSSSYCAV